MGDYALEFEVVYFVANRRETGRSPHADAVNRGIVARFGAAGIGLAYPTRRALA